jgi:hypothetical protein
MIFIGCVGKTAPTRKSTIEACNHLPIKSGTKEMHMEISNNNPVSNQVQGLEATPRANEVKRDEEEVRKQAEDNPDFRISLSDESKMALSEMGGEQLSGQAAEGARLSDEEAVQLAQQTSAQIAQTDASISNQAIQKAIDLFT